MPPNRLSALFYVALAAGYGSGAYHASPDFGRYVERLIEFLDDHQADVYFEERVTDIAVFDGKISGVATDTGKVFTAKNYICNMDPLAAAKLIGLH